MISAIVLVNTEINTQKNVVETLSRIEGVEEAHALYGVYDVLVKIKAASIDSLKDLTNFHIRPTMGVSNSLTLMIMEDQNERGAQATRWSNI
jgi:DNA-binding Lrp family transcriptional regulator